MKNPEEAKEEVIVTEDVMACAEDIMRAFESKDVKALAEGLMNFFHVADELPHEEGPHIEEGEEEGPSAGFMGYSEK